jgi:hypothetical protein
LVVAVVVKSAPATTSTPILGSAIGASDAGASLADSGPVRADADTLSSEAGVGAPDDLGLGALGQLGELGAGDTVSPLGSGAPRQVHFGVILVTYDGAEGAPAKGARSKRDALALAAKLADDAKTDFRGAVQRGDNGSSEDVGTVKRGELEPKPEAALFALKPGEVSAAVDTPRGFWIVKRID